MFVQLHWVELVTVTVVVCVISMIELDCFEMIADEVLVGVVLKDRLGDGFSSVIAEGVLDMISDVDISSVMEAKINYHKISIACFTCTLTFPYSDIIALSNNMKCFRVVCLDHHALYLESCIAHDL